MEFDTNVDYSIETKTTTATTTTSGTTTKPSSQAVIIVKETSFLDKYYFIIITLTSIVFLILHKFLDVFYNIFKSYSIVSRTSNINSQTNKSKRKKKSKPSESSANPTIFFNWLRIKNLLLSLFHSVISSIIVFTIFLIYPTLLCSPIISYINIITYFFCFISGYFISDLILNIYYRKSYHSTILPTIEIIIHHSLSLLGFTICIVNSRYQGAVLLALLAEVHNIFLHTRSILSLMKWRIITILILNFIGLVLWRGIPLIALAAIAREPWIISGVVILATYMTIMGWRLYNKDCPLSKTVNSNNLKH